MTYEIYCLYSTSYFFNFLLKINEYYYAIKLKYSYSDNQFILALVSARVQEYLIKP